MRRGLGSAPTLLTALLAGSAVSACAASDDSDAAQQSVPTQASTAWAGGGRQNPPVGACMVLGPLPTPATQADLDGIRDTINEWGQGDTALQFRWATDIAKMTTLTFGGDQYSTSCTEDAAGNFSEPYRVFVDHGGRAAWSMTELPKDLNIPGCSALEGIGSQAEDDKGNPIQDPTTKLWKVEDGYMWGSSPEDQRKNKTCLYTLHMGLGMARNNYLHEAGHGLGLAHEQERSDSVCNDGAAPPEGPDGNVKVTAYDRDSVMHYVWSCPDGTTVDGNWGSGGLTATDRLAMEIMHPKNLLAATFGQSVGWAGGGGLWSTATLFWRGGRVSDTSGPGGLQNFSWSVDGRRLSTSARTGARDWAAIGVGRHALTLSFQNYWGDTFRSTSSVEVLASKADYDKRAAAVIPFL